jgi:hypothetical protein
MWKCLNCQELIEDSFDACWNCGVLVDGTDDPTFQRDPDAPSLPDPPEESIPETSENRNARRGIAYTSFADFALLIGQGCALLGCVVAIIYGVLCLMAESSIGAVLLAPMSFFLSLANFVVFVRVSRL